MIRSHESFQESYLKVVKPKTKWDIFKFPPINLDGTLRTFKIEGILLCFTFMYVLDVCTEITLLCESLFTMLTMICFTFMYGLDVCI